jgi:hypothetical protein
MMTEKGERLYFRSTSRIEPKYKFTVKDIRGHEGVSLAEPGHQAHIQ